ncbi:hypothetical protein GCM10007386_37970 [Pseudoduganella dura]|nr:hypothetical protein GCM10007386_37970 [Pseudoduganella dura]
MAAMKALLRTLLLWFLLAGVPLQGFAAATMLLCGPGLPAAAPSAIAPKLPAAMQMDSHHEHDHDRAAMPAAQHDSVERQVSHDRPAHDYPGHDYPPHPQPDASHGDHVKCASAGACCTGAPLAPSLPAAPPLQKGRCATVPFVAAAPAAVDLAGLERPPKFPTA